MNKLGGARKIDNLTGVRRMGPGVLMWQELGGIGARGRRKPRARNGASDNTGEPGGAME